MADIPHCPTCGAPLPPGAAEQPCPACLMRLGLESWAGRTNENDPTAAYPGKFEAPAIEDLSQRLPQFELLELVGQGGMGAVYKARQKSLERIVAVKIINPQAAGKPGFAERFGREARAMARMNHPNIVTIHDFGSVDAPLAAETGSGLSADAQDAGEADGRLYFLIMEYVEGTNVRVLMRQKQLEPQEALAIIPPLCDALQYAHEEGIVHRDIKPENILIDKKGRVKIADFGLAKLLGQTPREITLTEASQALGTLHYMAPEQFERPLEVDHRADIYALGVTFYEMLTGELPIGRFAPPSQKVAVDVRFDEIVLRTLEREPARRYQHASDVKTDVEAISVLSKLAVEPTSVGEDVASMHPLTQHWAARAGLLTAAVLLGYIATKLFFPDISQPLWMGVFLLIMLGFVLELLRSPGTVKALQAGFALLAGLAGALMYVFAVPEPLLRWLYDITGAEPGADDSTMMRALVAILIVGMVAGMAQLRRKIAKRNSSENVQKAAPAHAVPAVFAPGTGPRMLAFALGFVTSSLVAAMGIVLLIYGLTMYPPGEGPWSGFVGAGFGALVGGVGGLMGTWNNLRKMRGRIDLMHEPNWNWLDSLLLAYALFGIGCVTAGAIWWSSLNLGLKIATTVLGGIATFQGLGFLAWRLAVKRAATRLSAQLALDLRLILLAIGMMVCAMMMACGAVLIVVASINLPFGSGAFWGWIGSAFGFLFGGGGGLLGFWNTYRSMEGLPDWMAEGKRNAFDRWIVAIGGLGALLMVTGLVASPWVTATSVYAMELLGGILVLQSAIFVPIRFLIRRAARQETDPDLTARR